MRYLLRRAVIAAFLLVQVAAANAAETPPSAVVETLHDSLIDTMKEAGTSPFDTRSVRLAPVVAESFDMALIARVSMGRYWAKFDDDQRKEAVDALRRLTTATYAGRFDDYSGEEFRVISEESAPRGTVRVNSELITGDGDVIRIDYFFRSTADGWRIFDVLLDSKYSELTLRRSEYLAPLRRGGLDGLLAAIEKKIASYNTSGAAK